MMKFKTIKEGILKKDWEGLTKVEINIDKGIESFMSDLSLLLMEHKENEKNN